MENGVPCYVELLTVMNHVFGLASRSNYTLFAIRSCTRGPCDGKLTYRTNGTKRGAGYQVSGRYGDLRPVVRSIRLRGVALRASSLIQRLLVTLLISRFRLEL